MRLASTEAEGGTRRRGRGRTEGPRRRVPDALLALEEPHPRDAAEVVGPAVTELQVGEARAIENERTGRRGRKGVNSAPAGPALPRGTVREREREAHLVPPVDADCEARKGRSASTWEGCSRAREEDGGDALILSSRISLWLHRCSCFLLRKMVWNTWSSNGLSCSLSWYWNALQSKHISSLRSSPGFCLMRYILRHGGRECQS